MSHPRFGFFLVLGADIHPDVGELWHLVAFFAGKEMGSPAGNYSLQRTLAGPHGQVLTQENLHVPAADWLDIQEAVVIDVLHHQADLIAMPGEHDARLAARIERGNHVAVPIGADFVGMCLGPVADDVLHRSFKTGGAWSFEEVFEKNQRLILHGKFPLTTAIFLIATVDKFAAMPWTGQVASFF